MKTRCFFLAISRRKHLVAISKKSRKSIFEIIKNGTKDIEVRVNDEKRRTLKIGDKILFLNRDYELETIILNVIKLEYYKNFKELVNHYPMERMYLNDYTKEDFLKELARFYTEEEQEEYGVVAIIFERE